MDQVIEFFKGLFAVDLWPARWHCGKWTDFHGWLYIISDLMIWGAYFAIPFIIIQYFSSKKSGLNFQKAYVLFAAFILLCGTSHFLDAIMFWIPMYRLNALIRFITGVVSLFTVYHLIKILPLAFKQKTNIELMKEIERREAAEKSLEEANKGLEAFAYIASHDLQEPLRKIKTFSTMLEKSNENNFDAKSKEYTHKIVKSTEKMQQLITDVLSLSLLSDSVAFEATLIEDAISFATEDLEIKIAEKQAEIYSTPIPPVKGYSMYLNQLFYNLLSNSLKFCDKRPVVQISGEKVGDYVHVLVKDNGIGMSKEESEKIFGAFVRLNGRSQYEGSGIGLAICKKIVDIHNGKIWVDSSIGEGTTFTIILPAA